MKKIFYKGKRISILSRLPFIVMHLACLLVFVVGVSPAALIVFFITLIIRMFGLTAGFHRYCSHKSFKTSRVFQFILLFIGTSAAQLGPLWWAGHHRHHHHHTDQKEDLHSPSLQGFFWSHIGWIMSPDNYKIDFYKKIPDFAKFPEIRLLDKFYFVPPLILALGLCLLGLFLEQNYHQLNTSAAQILVWGFFVSTVVLYHLTFSINSLAHLLGARRFETKDTSRNNIILALLTMGEGWHNNHHRYACSEKQGFYWWQLDFTHYLITLLSCFKIVWDIRKPTEDILLEGLKTRKNYSKP